MARVWRLPAVCAVALCLAISVVALAPSAPTQAESTSSRLANIITVSASIQAAINSASDGDSVFIPAGLYTESATLDKPVSLIGADANTTIIHALANLRVLTVTGASITQSTVISGLTFTGGDVTAGNGTGGGIYIVDGAAPSLRNLVVRGNRASAGGGIFASAPSPLMLEHGNVYSNSASNGGGIFAGSFLTLSATTILSNTAQTGGGVYAMGAASLSTTQVGGNIGALDSGGMYVKSAANLQNSLVENNSSQFGVGGVFAFAPLWLTDTCFISNSGQTVGGVNASGPMTATGSRFEQNRATGASNTALAGGLYANLTANLSNTVFIRNSTGGSGGGAHVEGAAFVSGGQFVENTSAQSNHGGGLDINLGPMWLTDTQFIANKSGVGGALFMWSPATLWRVQVLSNSASYGGGIGAFNVLTLTSAFVNGNVSDGLGGGVFSLTSLRVEQSEFLHNLAVQGGAIYQGPNCCFPVYTGTVTLVNSLFAQNVVTISGAELYLSVPGNTTLLHDTVGDDNQNPQVAIVIGSSTAGISDTIIASHTVAISATTGTVYEDYNLFFANGANLAGAIASGGHSIGGDPKFVAPSTGDYHLSAGSAAIDAGVNVGVLKDYDGQHRPYGAGFDIGYDERPADPTAVRVENFDASSVREDWMSWLIASGAAGVLLIGVALWRRAT